VLVAVEAGAPHTLQQLAPAEGPTRVLQQEVQQIEFTQRERHRLVIPQQLATHGVKPERAEAQRVRRR
jgi:hypothetical protein